MGVTELGGPFPRRRMADPFHGLSPQFRESLPVSDCLLAQPIEGRTPRVGVFNGPSQPTANFVGPPVTAAGTRTEFRGEP